MRGENMGEGPDSNSDRIRSVRRAILKWFTRHGREFPWRHSENSFHILLAEILLRRTTAAAVARVFPGFVSRFKEPSDLAEAHLRTLEKELSSLGLQTVRARHMRETARRILLEHNSVVPQEAAALRALPGVGRYISAAVRNFAFGIAEPMVDGNVVYLMNRVFSLGLSGPDDPRAWSFMGRLGGRNQQKQLYWGIIDLVSTVCLRKSPRCSLCPLSEDCEFLRTIPSPNLL
jgi:A/G-specific adenine glycosylase